MSQEQNREMTSGAISPSQYRAQVVRNINQATINLSSIFTVLSPENVSVRSSDLTMLIENSKKAVGMLEEQEKKDVEFLILGIFSGLLFGIIGNLIISLFVEIYNIYFPAASNLSAWTTELAVVVIVAFIVSWYLYRKTMGKIRITS
jgi:uncharacterized membrane protein